MDAHTVSSVSRGTRWPIMLSDVLAARERIAPHLPVTPLRSYPVLDAAVGSGIQVFVKHENHLPTSAFKVRNGLSLLTSLPASVRERGVIAATRGNHGLGVAWAGRLLACPVTICVPHGNNGDKNEGIRALGAELVVEGRDYDETLEVAQRLASERGLHLAHSTNDPAVIAGAATITLEMLEQEPELDAVVVAVGGGSQAVGALTVARALQPSLRVYGVQAAGASACHDSWHAGTPIARASADTFADGLATRSVYAMTFEPLREGLAGFVTVTDAEIAEAMRLVIRASHNLVEGAGAAGLAGVTSLRQELAGLRVAVVLSGANIDVATLRRVIDREI
jgi:threonine dehydratase